MIRIVQHIARPKGKLPIDFKQDWVIWHDSDEGPFHTIGVVQREPGSDLFFLPLAATMPECCKTEARIAVAERDALAVSGDGMPSAEDVVKFMDRKITKANAPETEAGTDGTS